jgi:hypothetical protein
VIGRYLVAGQRNADAAIADIKGRKASLERPARHASFLQRRADKIID